MTYVIYNTAHIQGVLCATVLRTYRPHTAEHNNSLFAHDSQWIQIADIRDDNVYLRLQLRLAWEQTLGDIIYSNSAMCHI